MRAISFYIIAAGAICLPIGNAAGQASSTTWYQVTYSDGTIKDSPTPPTTNEGIRLVVRMARVESAESSGDVVTSTDTNQPTVTVAGAGKTVSTNMEWNGSAWVVADTSKAAGQRSRIVHYQVTFTDGTIKDLSAIPLTNDKIRLVTRIARFEEDDASGYKVLSTDPNGPVRTDVGLGKTVSVGMEWNGKAWVAPGDQTVSKDDAVATAAIEKAPAAVGKISTADACPIANGAAPAAAPADQTRVMPYKMQVWKLAPGTGKRTYVMSLPHAEAGAMGAFYYVAYSDTNGDGTPDKLIARSALAQAEKPGQWTSWSFETEEQTVFAGNAWANENTSIYCQQSDKPPAAGSATPQPGQQQPAPAQPQNGGDPGMDQQAWVSGLLFSPDFKTYQPYIQTNLRVKLQNDDDNKPKTPPPPPVVIER